MNRLATPPPPATLRFHVEAGVLIRGQVRRRLREAAWDAGLDISIDEDRGWLDSTLFVTVTGEGDAVARYSKAVLTWCEGVSS